MDTKGFNVGDVVMLKSGSHRMTISGIGVYSMAGEQVSAKCQWFAGTRSEDLKSGIFPLESLEKVSDE